MLTRTIFLSRMFGVYCILMALFVSTHPERALETVRVVGQDPPLMLILAILLIFGGLAMVLEHNVWSGGAAPVIVTLIGWVTLAKGVVLLFASPEKIADFYGKIFHNAGFVYIDAAVALALGVYLTYAGFKSSARREA